MVLKKKQTPFILISYHGSQFFSKSQITTQKTVSSFMKANGSLRFLEYCLNLVFKDYTELVVLSDYDFFPFKKHSNSHCFYKKKPRIIRESSTRLNTGSYWSWAVIRNGTSSGVLVILSSFFFICRSSLGCGCIMRNLMVTQIPTKKIQKFIL